MIESIKEETQTLKEQNDSSQTEYEQLETTIKSQLQNAKDITWDSEKYSPRQPFQRNEFNETLDEMIT